MNTKLQITRPVSGVVLLTLNRPEVSNAIDMELFELLETTLAQLEEDPGAKALVLAGAADRAFCAGFDIHEMAGFDPAAMAAAFARRDPLFWQIARHRKPIVAALNGVTYGAGALMAVASDLRIGCSRTRFKVTATSYGAASATWSLPRIVGVPKAKEILLTGRVVEAVELLALGLINQFVRDRSVTDAAVEMAAMIASNPSEGVEGVKALINESLGHTLQQGYRAEHDWMTAHMGTSKGGAEIFDAFLSKGQATSADD